MRVYVCVCVRAGGRAGVFIHVHVHACVRVAGFGRLGFRLSRFRATPGALTHKKTAAKTLAASQ